MTLPNVDMNLLDQPTLEKVQAKELDHPPRILLLYGSNRERSYSRLAVMEAGRILEQFGAEVKIFHPKGLPLPEDADTEHPKVKELHDLLAWAEGMVWCSPERHGSMSSISNHKLTGYHWQAVESLLLQIVMQNIRNVLIKLLPCLIYSIHGINPNMNPRLKFHVLTYQQGVDFVHLYQ